MRVLILATVLIPASSAALQPQRNGQAPASELSAVRQLPLKNLGSDKKCDRPGLITADGSVRPPRAQNLGELPTGALTFAVMREVDGCLQPAIVRYGYGAGQAQSDSLERPKAVLSR